MARFNDYDLITGDLVCPNETGICGQYITISGRDCDQMVFVTGYVSIILWG